MRIRVLKPTLAALLRWGAMCGVAPADEDAAARFLQRWCSDCHSGSEPEAGFDIKTSLQVSAESFDSSAALERGVRLFDRVRSGEMPPADANRPSDADRSVFLASLGAQLTAAHQRSRGTVLRRLNRQEYENTLNDLFGTHLELAPLLPEDGRAHSFSTVGDALSLSSVHVQRYLEAADLVWETAIAHETSPPERQVVRASYADTRGADRFVGKNWLKLDDGAVVFFKQWGYPTGMLRESNVRQSGWYKVRVRGYAYQSETPITFSIGATTFARGAEQPTFGYFAMPPGEPATIEITAWIEDRYMIQIEPWGITDDFKIKSVGLENYDGPGLAVLHVDVEGPLTDEFPSRGHRMVFDGLDRREIPPRNPSDRERSSYRPTFEIVAENPEDDVAAPLQRVATRAFRRPVDLDEIEPYRALFAAQLAGGTTFEEALRTAVTAIFCSPQFLFLQEAPGTLDDFALASRLSYFLTRTLPDETLLELAARGELAGNEAVLLEQTERLLDDPRLSRFINDYTDEWLDLRNIDFTVPDRTLYPEFDAFLKHSMLDESRAFFRELIAQNLGVRNLVISDFAMLNSRLAEHYGIDGVTAPHIERVRLPAGSHRGGVLTQGAVLKVSANGTNTSPVVRGVWVLERLLGQVPPPPPPGISGVEPDIRGAQTLRELLDKHRDVDSCRHCHQMIDPPGFALESFNPIGGWRDRFRSLGEGDRVDLQINGLRVRYKLGREVDAAGELADGADGRAFAGFDEFQKLLAEDEQRLARAFLTHLLTFATGRELGFSDRPEIERLVRAAGESDYGIRDMIRLAVTSEIFQTK